MFFETVVSTLLKGNVHDFGLEKVAVSDIDDIIFNIK